MESQKFRQAVKLIYSNSLQELYPQPYNVLNNFGNNGLNENDHSKFLLSVLKYIRPGAREYKMPILHSFFETMGIVPMVKEEDVEISFSNVYVDEKGKSFPDGLILRKNDFAVIIENKICDAADQPDQIKRYILSVKDKDMIPLENIWVVYMTKDGTLHEGRPTAQSYDEDALDFNDYNIGEHLICVNYRYDIIPWLKNEVLPMVANSESMLAHSIEAYVNHLETSVLFSDELTRRRAELMKSNVLNVLGIENGDAASMYSQIMKCISELDVLEVLDPDESKVAQLRSSLVGYMDAITSPLLENFAQVTKSIFYEKKNVFVKAETNKLSYGYIKILTENPDPAVHYEWAPVDMESFLSSKTFALLIHIEGKKNESKKKSFDNNHLADFSIDFEDLCNKGILKSTQKHKCAIAVNLDDTIPDLIAQGKLKDTLSPYYERALKYFDELMA